LAVSRVADEDILRACLFPWSRRRRGTIARDCTANASFRIHESSLLSTPPARVLSLSHPPSFRVVKAAVAVTRARRCRGTPPIFLPLLFKVEDGETSTNDVDKDDDDDDAFRAAVAMPTSRDAALLFFFALKSGEAAAVDDAKTVDMMMFFFLPYYARVEFFIQKREHRKKALSLSLSNISTRSDAYK